MTCDLSGAHAVRVEEVPEQHLPAKGGRSRQAHCGTGLWSQGFSNHISLISGDNNNDPFLIYESSCVLISHTDFILSNTLLIRVGDFTKVMRLVSS